MSKVLNEKYNPSKCNYPVFRYYSQQIISQYRFSKNPMVQLRKNALLVFRHHLMHGYHRKPLAVTLVFLYAHYTNHSAKN